MFDHIGQKLKSLAKGVFAIETAAAIIAGFVLMADDAAEIGLPMLLLGPLGAWVSSCFLYAFGELVDKTTRNEAHTKAILEFLCNKPNAVPEEEQIEAPGSKQVERVEKAVLEGEFEVTIQADVAANLVFSRYDVCAFVDGVRQCVIGHGLGQTIKVNVGPGEHVVTFEKSDDPSVKKEITFTAEQNLKISCRIFCYSDFVEVEKN